MTAPVSLLPITRYPALDTEQLLAQRELLTHYPTTSALYRQAWRVVNLCLELQHQQAIEAAAARRVNEIRQRLMEVTK